jgi:hypothetical protein
MGSKGYEVVPYGFFVNKEGGLSTYAFDVGNVERKLGRWMNEPKNSQHFALWNGDRGAVMEDIYKYLDNQRQGLPNSLHLDSNPTFAVQKRNLITDLLGGRSVAEGQIPTPLSTPAGRDNSVRSYRIDRFNQLRNSGGENFPVDYYKVKQNLMPGDPGTSPLPSGVTPGAVIKQAQAQATYDFKTRLVSGGAPDALADQIATTAWKKADQAARRSGLAPSERAHTIRAADRLNQLGPQDLEAIRTATIKGGTDGAAKEIEKRLLVAPMRGQRIPVRVK